MWRCFVRDQARVPSVAGAVAPFFVTGTVFFSPARRDPIGAATDGAPARSGFSVVAGRGVGRDMGDATNAPLPWPETTSVQLVAPPRPASPAAAPRRRATPPPRIATYRAQHCVAHVESTLYTTARGCPAVPAR